MIAAILEREPAPLDIAPPLDRVIRTCLAKDPDQRFQTAPDLKRALQWAMLPEAAPEPAPVRAYPWFRVALVLTAMVVLGTLGGYMMSSFRRPPAGEEGAIRLELTPPEGSQFVFGSNVGGIALSPNGRVAAYVVSVQGKTGLWIRPLDASSANLLPGTEGAANPFWSPDSKTIGFLATGKLQRIEIAGGEPQTICDQLGRGGAWTSDHRILFGSTAEALFIVPDPEGLRPC